MNCSDPIILVLELKFGHLVAAVSFIVGLKFEVQINSSFGLVEIESVSFLYQAQNICVAAGYVWLALSISVCGGNHRLVSVCEFKFGHEASLLVLFNKGNSGGVLHAVCNLVVS